MPWQDVEKFHLLASDFMARIVGAGAPRSSSRSDALDGLRVRFFASARILARAYGGGVDGDYFKIFARVIAAPVSPRSLAGARLGGHRVLLFRLADVVTALVVIRILDPVSRADARHHRLRDSPAGFSRPFRMWLYPCARPAGVCGLVYTVVMRPKSIESIRPACSS